MLKHATRAMLAVLVLVLTMGVLPASAQAAPQCTVPEFKSTQTVYVDPGLANDPSYPERLTGLSETLKPLAAQHHLAVYVIACQEDYVSGSSRADDLANEAIARWSTRSDFPKADALIIVWMRKQGDPNHLQISAVGGSRLLAYGYGPTTMSDRTNGPMNTPDLRRDLNDPKGMIVHVVERINKGVSDFEYQKALPGMIAQGVTGGVGVIAFLVVGFLFFRKRSKATKLIASSQTKVNEASARYIELHGNYFGFLKEQGTDWRARFVGITLERYDSAVKKYSDLTVRFEVAKEVLAEAITLNGKNIAVYAGWAVGVLGLVAGVLLGQFGMVGVGVAVLIGAVGATLALVPMLLGAGRAVKKLTTDIVEITGDKLPLDQRPLFGSTVTVEKFQADTLWGNLNDLYTQCNLELNSIVEAFKGARTNKDKATSETSKAEALKPELTKRTLVWDPYAERYDQVIADVAAFVAIIDKNPLEAFQQSEGVQKAADLLEDEIRRAIALWDSLGEVETVIGKSVTRVADVRKLLSGYAYPDGEALAVTAGDTFILNEDGGNPDDGIADANKQLAACRTAVKEARLDEADAARVESLEFAQKAFALVQEIIDAKAEVETAVPKAKANLVKLDNERPAGQQDMAAIRADFIPENFSAVAKATSTAKAVSEATAGELAKIKTAYFEQRYIAARNLVRNLGKDIQGSRDGIVALNARLAELRRLRKHAKDIVAQATTLSADLRTKLAENSFTTSAAVDSSYKKSEPMLAAQTTDVALPITDWVAAAEAADQLLAKLQKVDSDIDTQKAAHAQATREVQELSTAISGAKETMEHDDTRNPAKTKYSEAKAALRQVSSDIAQPKSDWATIGANADAKTKLVGEAVKLAQADQTAASEARAEIKKAAEKIAAVDGTSFQEGASVGGSYKTFGIGVSADLSTANSHLRSARQYLTDKNFESAESEAKSAYTAAENARKAAAKKVDDAIQAAITAYNIAEAARKRQEQSNNGGGFNGGGGGGRPGGNAGGGRVGGGNAGGNEL